MRANRQQAGSQREGKHRLLATARNHNAQHWSARWIGHSSAACGLLIAAPPYVCVCVPSALHVALTLLPAALRSWSGDAVLWNE